MPYHPEIKELAIDNNAIGDDGLLLFIQSLSLRHDPNNVRTVYPIKLLQRLNLSNNQISDVYVGELLDNLMVYTPYLREIDLSHNELTNKCCLAICDFLEEIDEKPKKQRVLKKISLRHNQIDFDGLKELNEIVSLLKDSWNIKIELGSNPTEQLYAFDADQKLQIDHRINMHGA